MYKLSKGIKILNENEIIDSRLDIKYNDKILYKLLMNIKLNNLFNLDSYIEGLNISEKNKKCLRLYFDFCIKRKLISKTSIITDGIIWRNSRIAMVFEYFFRMLIWLIPILPFIYINIYYCNQKISFLINLYTIYLFSITIHEIGHALSYFLFQKDINGYFNINHITTSFNYSESKLSPPQRIAVAISGFFASMIFLLFAHIKVNVNCYIILINIIYQCFSFILGTDAAIVLNALKK